MSYVVNTGSQKSCDRCKSRIGIERGFYSHLGRHLCLTCYDDDFGEFIKEKFNEFMNLKCKSCREIVEAAEKGLPINDIYRTCNCKVKK